MTDPQRGDAAIAARLRARRAELTEAAAAHEGDRRPVQLDQTRIGRLSRLDALQEQAMATELERRREVELARIDAALERLAEGEYSWCVTCGEAVEPPRLELIRRHPFASPAPGAPASTARPNPPQAIAGRGLRCLLAIM